MEGVSTMNDDYNRPIVTRYGVFLFCVCNICMALTWMYDL